MSLRTIGEKSAPAASSGPSRRVPSSLPAPLRSQPPGAGAALARRQSGRGTGLGHSEERRAGERGGGGGEGRLRHRPGRAERAQSGGGAGTVLAKREGAGGRAGGRRAAQGEARRKARVTRRREAESSPREARPRGSVRLGRCASPWHARWKVFKAAEAGPGPRELPPSDVRAPLPGLPNRLPGTPRACGREQVPAHTLLGGSVPKVKVKDPRRLRAAPEPRFTKDVTGPAVGGA